MTNENKKLGIFGLFDLNWGGDGDTWKSTYENPSMEVLWCEATWMKPLLPHDVYNQNICLPHKPQTIIIFCG
jgi:hypothetical protein